MGSFTVIGKNFILAGNATFTIQNTLTGNRFTYRVRQPSTKSPHFVQVLTGPNNESDYQFLGTIFDEEVYRHGKKSPIGNNAPSEIAFRWTWQNFDRLPDCIEINHEGHCGRCGRLLTTPESVASGIGPVCTKNLLKDH